MHNVQSKEPSASQNNSKDSTNSEDKVDDNQDCYDYPTTPSTTDNIGEYTYITSTPQQPTAKQIEEMPIEGVYTLLTKVPEEDTNNLPTFQPSASNATSYDLASEHSHDEIGEAYSKLQHRY